MTDAPTLPRAAADRQNTTRTVSRRIVRALHTDGSK